MLIKRVLLFLVLIFLIGFCDYAFAHRVNLFCYFEDGFLVGQGYYSRGNPAKNANIEIYSLENGSLISKLQTDSNGEFKIKLDDNNSLKVVMNAGQGHGAEFIVEGKDNITAQSSSKKGGKQEQKQKKVSMISVIGGVGIISGIFLLIFLIKRKHAF